MKLPACLAALVAFGALSPPAEAKSKKLKPGKPAPSFRLRALDGTMVKLDELSYKGREKSYAKKRPILIDFFRTDCAPCIKALPDLVELYKKQKGKGLDVLLIALLEEERGREKIEAFLAANKLPFMVVVDSAEHFSKKYLGDPVTLPASFLIDREGVLRKVKYGAKGTYQGHFNEAMAKVLEEHQKKLTK